MPTLPLFDPPATPDAWHRVRAPGGYEQWHLDAEDAGGETRIVATLTEGCTGDPAYLREYARYRRRPTKHRPPVPGDWPCAQFAVYRGMRERGQFVTRVGPAEFAASAQRVQVRVGANQLLRVDEGLSLVVSGRCADGAPLEGEFLFRPRWSGVAWEGTFPSRGLAGAEHRWVVADPRCAVQGVFSIGGERVVFAGHGYRDHRYGTGPARGGSTRWMKGRVLLPQRTLAFQVAYPRDAGAAAEAILIEADGDGVRELPVEFRTGLKPQELEFGKHLRLTRPRELDREMDWTVYDAAAGEEVGTALCEIVRP